MITVLTDGSGFDTKLEYSDWRFSAAAVGLVRYFKYCEIEFEQGEDYIAYQRDTAIGDAAERNYLRFVENFFTDGMHHLILEDLLTQDNLTKEQIALVNEKLNANGILKKVFGRERYEESQKGHFLALLEENRQTIIKETYRNGKSLYWNFANENSLGKGSLKICRLNGYYIDLPKKGKSLAYQWDPSTFVAQDVPEFDYIPFAFSKSYESFFINNNYNTKELLKANDHLSNAIKNLDKPRKSLFFATQQSSGFVDYDVEIIVKKRNQEYFETLLVRRPAINIFKKISGFNQNGENLILKALSSPCRLNNGDYVDLEQSVTDNILNLIHLDYLIELLLKDKLNHNFQISQLIRINQLIYQGGEGMENKSMKGAYMAAKEVIKVFKNRKAENKINSYKQKLISALTFKDYDRFNEILLQLSSYSGVPFNFAYDLFEDFDQNKNIAYTFVNALNDDYVKQEGDQHE